MNRSDFNIHFDHAFQSKKKTEFEEWFCNMAHRVHGPDFEPIKAGGQKGDKKSDGRLISSETVFQCYAPESPVTFAKNGPAKVRDSFPEVLNHWPNIKEWMFVHNNDQITGLVSDALEEMRTQYPNIKILTGERNFLKDQFHDKLTLVQLGDIYSEASLDFSSVQMENIRPLLQQIREGRNTPTETLEFGEDPEEEKLNFNELSSDAKYAITRAYSQIRLVDAYFEKLSNPAHANVIQKAMRDEYGRLKDLSHQPDDILANLLKFAGDDGSEPVRAAAYVIVTYHFDSCDVFENVPSVV